MSAGLISFRHGVLAWSEAPQDETRFARIQRSCLLLALSFALVLPWLPRPAVPRAAEPSLAPPVARLQLELEPARTPPRPVASNPPPQAVVPGPRPLAVVPEARRPQPRKAAGERDERQPLASGVGLLALRQQFAQIHGAPSAVQLQTALQPGRGVGAGQGPGVGAGSEPGLPARALVTAQAGQGSGGIDTSGFSRDAGGGGLAGRATTLVAGVAGGAGGGGFGGGGVGVPGARGGAAALRASPQGDAARTDTAGKARRSIEDIKLVFDRNKGSIYALYNRALRDEPALQGKVVLELKIAPTGAVVDCRIVASELQAADLERKLLARVRQFDFGAKDVETMVVAWPVDFLPS